MRLIDKERIIKGIKCSIGIRGVKDCDNCPYDENEQCLGCDVVLLRDALEIIETSEPEKIVRCMDCKYYGYKNMTNVDGFCFCFKRKEYPYPDWYCADGERR